jgi:hypothetical protein
MTANEQWQQNTTDPLGLRELESIEPDFDGWDEIEAALKTHQQGKRRLRRTGGWLAVAASLVLVVSISLLRHQDPAPGEVPLTGPATLAENSASVTDKDNVSALIGLSQTMEEQVMKLRQSTGSMPADTAIYVAEIEDLIAQVDGELSVTPDSVDLWGQRVNLMLDLAQIYQQQWEIDYGRMASL